MFWIALIAGCSPEPDEEQGPPNEVTSAPSAEDLAALEAAARQYLTAYLDPDRYGAADARGHHRQTGLLRLQLHPQSTLLF